MSRSSEGPQKQHWRYAKTVFLTHKIDPSFMDLILFFRGKTKHLTMLLRDHCGGTVVKWNSIHCAYFILSGGFLYGFAVSLLLSTRSLIEVIVVFKIWKKKHTFRTFQYENIWSRESFSFLSMLDMFFVSHTTEKKGRIYSEQRSYWCVWSTAVWSTAWRLTFELILLFCTCRNKHLKHLQ